MYKIIVLYLAIIIYAFQTLHSENINDSLVAYWNFEDTYENFIPDESGNGWNGIANVKPLIIDGIKGKCMSFTGKEWVMISDNSLLLNGECEITFSAYIYPQFTDNYRHIIFISGDAYRNWLDPIVFQIVDNKPADFGFQNAIKKQAIRVNNTDFPAILPKNKWTHLAAVLSNENNKSTLKVYVNGNLVQEISEIKYVYNEQIAPDSQLCITYDKPMFTQIGAVENEQTWIGALDEIKLWKRKLSDCEILSLYDSSIINTPNIIGDSIFCLGDSIKLEVLQDFKSYYWSTGEKTKSIVIKEPGLYSVAVIDNYGCKWYNDIKIKVYPKPIVNIKKNGDFECFKDTISIIASEGYSNYQWYRDSILINESKDPELKITQPGKYYVKVFNEFGCASISNEIVIDNNYKKEDVFDFYNNNNFNFENSILGELKKYTIKIKNKSFLNQFIDNIILTQNTKFSIPQSQFPISFNPYELKSVDLVFFSYDTNFCYDTIYYKDICSEYYIPINSRAISNYYVGSSKCDVNINAFSTRLLNNKIIFSSPYPNPSTNEIKINYSYKIDQKKELISFILYDFMGNYVVEGVNNILNTTNDNGSLVENGEVVFNLHNIVSSTYFIHVVIANTHFCYPIILTK